MTQREIHERILELDAVLFKGETGQIHLEWDEYQTLKKEADSLMSTLAQSVSESRGCSFEIAYESRDHIRRSNLIVATIKRHLALHPELAEKEDLVMAAAFAGLGDRSKSNEEVSNELAAIYGYMFENAPKPPVETARKGLFRRIFNRSE